MTKRHPLLAAIADRVLADRRRQCAAEVKAGSMAQEEADFDIAAWTMMGPLFRDGSVETDRVWSFAELELATGRELLRREHALEEAKMASAPADHIHKLTLQRDAVYSIHEKIGWNRYLVVDLPNEARARWAAERAATAAA